MIGRCGDYILRDDPHMISVFISADEETCIAHVMERMYCTRKDAMRYIAQNDKFRSEYYSYHTGRKWRDPANYDLCINTSKIGYEKAANIIKDYVAMRQNG